MKKIFCKILNTIKIIGLFIKKIIRKVLSFTTRTLYIVMALGYLSSLAAVYYIQDYAKGYNMQALTYVEKANDGYKSYETVKNLDKVEDIVKDKLNKQYKKAEKDISESVKNIDEKQLGREMLFGKKIEDTSFIKDIKQTIKTSFDIDLSKEMKSIVSSQNSHPTLDKVASLFESEKILKMVLLLLTFPFLSPIVLACVVIIIMSKKYIKKVSSPNEVNYLTMAPSIYIMNMVLAIVALTVFYFNQTFGLVVVAAAHSLFILKIVNGIRLKNLGKCLSCNQALPDEMDTIKAIKAKEKSTNKPKAKKTKTKAKKK